MNIIFVGLSGVPYAKRACDTRLLSFADIFIRKKHKVSVLNRLPTHHKTEREKDYLSSHLKIIELFGCDKPQNLLVNIFLILLSYPKEFFWLITENKKERINVLHLYSGHYFEFLHYYIISKIIRAKIIYQYVEVRSGIKRQGWYHKLNGILCDRYGYMLFDGVITISNYIDHMVNHLSPKLIRIKVPPICDINYFDNIKVPSVNKPYILFCGNAGFYEVIQLIIDSYRMSNAAKKYKLKLVLSGSDKYKKRVKDYAKIGIDVISGLSYDDLVKEYLGASALLIPLRNTIQDVARFPNKICEYTACKGLIITNNVGEIPYFFTDGSNALIADNFTVEAIANKLDLMDNMDQSDISQIKDGSYQLCKSFFDTSVYSNDLDLFLNRVVR